MSDSSDITERQREIMASFRIAMGETGPRPPRKADREQPRCDGSGSADEGLPEALKRCCGCNQELPASAYYVRKSGPERGRITSECKACTSARTSARWAASRAKRKKPVRNTIDWTNPPAEMACTGCGVVYSTESYPLAGVKTKGANVRKRKCKTCRNAEQVERNNRFLLSSQQLHYAARAEAHCDVFVIRPTCSDSLLGEAGIARELYETALRALAAPALPVWEREEYA